MVARNQQSKGQHEIEYCPGYVDEHGQWNNGFYCPKWSSKPNQQYCCGSQYKRHCCPPGESPQRVTQQALTTSASSKTTTGVATKALTTPLTTVSVTSVALSSPILENIPLIVGVAAGGVVLLVLLIIICCCVCPCCPMRKHGRDKGVPPDDEKSVERERERRISDVSDISLQRPLTPSYRSESPTNQEMTVIPTCYTDSDTMSGSIPLSRTKHSPYKTGVVVGTVPPYVREEPPAYPEEVMETLKPLMYGQFCCGQRNCPKCQNMRLQEVCPMEVEMDPHQHCMTSPLSNSVSSLHKQNYGHLKQGRYVRPLTPVLTPQGYRHFQIQNRSNIM
ncbi:uncharacterized protein LOC135471084 [Liolophura sinensis]|uniref:uncharacterized protein LOC135471084 n=1 Tax=Liolophura sinensis TaxID=3198878 RepID=UPI0031598698